MGKDVAGDARKGNEDGYGFPNSPGLSPWHPLQLLHSYILIIHSAQNTRDSSRDIDRALSQLRISACVAPTSWTYFPQYRPLLNPPPSHPAASSPFVWSHLVVTSSNPLPPHPTPPSHTLPKGTYSTHYSPSELFSH